MKLQLAVAAAVAMFSLSSLANAEPVVAKLKASTAGAVKPVAGGAVFECLGDVCASRAPSSDTATLRGCKDLARQVGGVNSYGPASKPLSADQVSVCNESARK